MTTAARSRCGLVAAVLVLVASSAANARPAPQTLDLHSSADRTLRQSLTWGVDSSVSVTGGTLSVLGGLSGPDMQRGVSGQNGPGNAPRLTLDIAAGSAMAVYDSAGKQHITGSGALYKTGGGALAIYSQVKSSGAITVEAGTLRLGGPTAEEPQAGDLVIEPHATLNQPAGTMVNRNTTVWGRLQIPGRIYAAETTFTQNLTLAPGAQLEVELGTPLMAGSLCNSSLLSEGKVLAFGGTVDIGPPVGNEEFCGNSFAGEGTYPLMRYRASAQVTVSAKVARLPAGYVARIENNPAQHQVNLLLASSTPRYWDGAGQKGNDLVDGQAGVWSYASSNWTDGLGTRNARWQQTGQQAVFAGSRGGAVRVMEPERIAGLDFRTDGYVLEGPGVLVSGPGDNVFHVEEGVTAIVMLPLVMHGNFIKSGQGTLILGGNVQLHGNLTVAGGNLQIGR